jgi:hypothetical protein
LGKMIVMKEDKPTVWEKTMEKANSIIGFKISFLGGNEDRKFRKVEVRKVNFQDLMRHMWRGESVLITPKLLENSSIIEKKGKNRAAWYFTHM